MSKKIVQYFILILLSLFVASFAFAQTYNPDYVISDYNYLDSDSMSANQIQTFLESKGSGLAKIMVKVSGALKRVADIFYEAAKKYGVSQRLLLVTAQKEQSAVTTENLTEDQKDKLMGYCIYPGSTCYSKYLGIYNQIDAAAWQFRRYYDYPQDYNFQKDKTTTTSDGYKVTPKNKSTAGLYNYTPNTGADRGSTINDTGWGGNFLFWKIWNSWFNDPLTTTQKIAKIITGVGRGGGPQVRSFYESGKSREPQFFAFNEEYHRGIYIAAGDVDGDSLDEIIVGSGGNSQPYVRIFDGNSSTPAKEFLAYNSNVKVGVRVAVGDLNGDGVKEIITAPGGGGGPHIRIFDSNGNPKFSSFFAYQPSFRGGVYVAASDLDGDGKDEIITGAGEGGGPHIRVFDRYGNLKLASFFSYDPRYKCGTRIAGGDLDGNGKGEIVAADGPGGKPNVRIFNRFGKKLGEFLAYDEKFKGGVYIAVGDLNGDGKDEIITGAGQGGGPHIRIFDYQGKVKGGFFAYGEDFRGGVRVATIY